MGDRRSGRAVACALRIGDCLHAGMPQIPVSMRVAATLVVFVSVLLCSCSTANVANRPPASGEGLYACVITFDSLNKLFEEHGYGQKFWEYLPIIWRDSRHDRLFVTQDSRKIFVIFSDGKIDQIEVPKDDFYLLGEDSCPLAIFNWRGLEIHGAGKVEKFRDEYVPLGDLAFRYYVRRFRDTERGDHFAVYRSGSVGELFRDTGKAMRAQSKDSSVYIVALAPPNNEWSFRRYDRTGAWHLAEAENIPNPTELRKGWDLYFDDLDVDHSLLLLTERASFTPFYDIAPRTWFRTPKVWLYDFKSRRYMSGQELPKFRGDMYVVLMPETFARASFVAWSRKVGD